MANFKDTEIETAVSRYVRSTVKTERTDLGPLDTSYAFDEVREFVGSTLVFDPSAVFYLLSLASNRVSQDVIQAIEYLDDIITGIGEVGRDTVVVTQTSLLADAAAALLEVERTIQDKNAIAVRPFSRYSQALDKFTNKSLTPNIRKLGPGFPDTYEIVRPPQQAQSAIKSNIRELRDLHPTVVAEANQLLEALAEFLAADLPLVAIQKSVSKVRSDLRSIKDSLDNSTRDGAIEKTRDVFLAIQAGKAVVTNLTTISDPRSSRMASSASSTDRAQAISPCATATPAGVAAQISAPYLITPTTNQIKLELDGGVEQVVTLTPPDPAFILGSVDETYDIHDISTAEMVSGLVGPYTVPASPDNVFSIYVDGAGYLVSLTPGSRSAAQVAAEINAATRIDGSPGVFDSVGTASDSGGSLKLVHDTAGSHSLALGAAPLLNPALGFTDGQFVSGLDANNELRLLTQDGAVTAVISLTNGSARTAAQVASDIDASPYFSASAAVITTSTGSITVVKILSVSYGEESHVKVASLTTKQQEAVQTLGFFEGQEDRGAYFKLSELMTALAGVTGIDTEVSYSTPFKGTGGTAMYSGPFYKLRVAAGILDSSASNKDMLFISNGANVGWYRISSVAFLGPYDEITVARPLPATTGSEAQNQAWEIHRDLVSIKSEDQTTASKIKVNTASANSALGLVVGTYIGSVSGVRVIDAGTPLNFTREDVLVGDKLSLRGPTYTTEHTVTAITYDGYQIEVTPEVQNDLVAHLYRIDGAGALAYEEFIEDLDDWFTSQLEPSKFDEDIQELERVLNPLLVNKNPSAALVGSASSTAVALKTVYESLSVILAGFTTTVVPRIDALLDMLQERGMDRAHELLLLGEFQEFFVCSKDSSSHSGNLLEKMRSIAQNDVPLGRGTSYGNTENRLTGSYEDTDANYDFSDQDSEKGPTEIDDIPDLDPEGDVLNRSL